MRMNYFLILLGCFLLAACQLPPTKSFSESSLRPRASHHESDQIFIGDLQKRGAVFVDVRSPFVAGLNRVPGAQNLWWEDFTVKNNAGVRKMQPDLFALTRRLALKGIAPDKPVVLVGSRIDVAACCRWTARANSCTPTLTSSSWSPTTRVTRAVPRTSSPPRASVSRRWNSTTRPKPWRSRSSCTRPASRPTWPPAW